MYVEHISFLYISEELTLNAVSVGGKRLIMLLWIVIKLRQTKTKTIGNFCAHTYDWFLQAWSWLV